MNFRILAFFLTAATLAGCVNQESFVKNNMFYSEFETDRAQCETKSTQEVAVNRSPGAEVAIALFTGIYEVHDANAVARQRNYEACMMSKGYQRISLPPCKETQKARKEGIGPLSAHEKVQFSEKTCWVGDSLGRTIFYTPS